jgi:hypothetical protein
MTQTTDGNALVADEALQRTIHGNILSHPEVLMRSLFPGRAP